MTTTPIQFHEWLAFMIVIVLGGGAFFAVLAHFFYSAIYHGSDININQYAAEYRSAYKRYKRNYDNWLKKGGIASRSRSSYYKYENMMMPTLYLDESCSNLAMWHHKIHEAYIARRKHDPVKFSEKRFDKFIERLER